MSIYKDKEFLSSRREAPNLDLRTLTDINITAGAYGFSQYGSGTGFAWTVTSFGGGDYEVLGVHTNDGMRPPTKRKASTKPRAQSRSQMTDENIDRTMRRTKKKVRELAMMLCPDKMLTLTTRKSIVEAEQFKRIASTFFRNCRRSDMKFEYVAVFERHMSKKTSAEKFGSLHLHVATKGFLNYNKLRHLWRKAVQTELKDGDYTGANINSSTSNHKGGHYDRRSIARYISKYLNKDMDDENFEPNKRRYWASKGIQKPEKIRLFSPPSGHVETFRQMFSDILGVDITKVFIPDSLAGQPPLIWLSNG